MAGMPHLVKVQEQYKAQGLIILASHLQNVPKDEVLALCRKNKVNYTVVNGGRLSGDDSPGLPHAWLLDGTGKVVKDGHVEELKQELEATLAREAHWIARGKKLEAKSALQISEGLKAGKSFGWALGECEALAKKNDEKAKAEAEYLRDQIVVEGERVLAEAGVAEEKDPVHALELYDEARAGWKKHEIEKKADARVKELKKDKAFQKELEAAKLAGQLRELAGQLVSKDGKYDLAGPQNQQTAAQIRGGLKQLKAKHAETKIGQACVDELKAFGF